MARVPTNRLPPLADGEQLDAARRRLLADWCRLAGQRLTGGGAAGAIPPDAIGDTAKVAQIGADDPATATATAAATAVPVMPATSAPTIVAAPAIAAAPAPASSPHPPICQPRSRSRNRPPRPFRRRRRARGCRRG